MNLLHLLVLLCTDVKFEMEIVSPGHGNESYMLIVKLIFIFSLSKIVNKIHASKQRLKITQL